EIRRATVFNYIECDYKRWRRHGGCGGLSPEQFENKNLA
ncbi:IS3 family transposase, partial [Escherichia coli]